MSGALVFIGLLFILALMVKGESDITKHKDRNKG